MTILAWLIAAAFVGIAVFWYRQWQDAMRLVVEYRAHAADSDSAASKAMRDAEAAGVARARAESEIAERKRHDEELDAAPVLACPNGHVGGAIIFQEAFDFTSSGRRRVTGAAVKCLRCGESYGIHNGQVFEHPFGRSVQPPPPEREKPPAERIERTAEAPLVGGDGDMRWRGSR